MKKLLKILAIILLAITVTACGSGEYDENGDSEESEEVTQGMEQYRMEQRDEFADLAKNRIEEWEGRLNEASDRERADALQERLDEISEKIDDVAQDDEIRWEERRDEIAEALKNLRSEIEDLE